MFAIALTLLRYVFLLLLFLFIFRLVKWMIGDLKEITTRDETSVQSPVRRVQKRPAGAAGAGLKVLESASPDLVVGESFGIDGEIVMGRGGKSDIPIADPFASTQHARIYLKDDQYWLEDLESTNGTFLNGVQVKKPTVLANGDRIRIGDVIFQFVRWGYEVGSGNG